MRDRIEEIMSDKYAIIFDTNVYLNIYEFSPHVASFFVELISDKRIKNQIYIPSIVKREFNRNHKVCHGRQKKKFQNVTYQLKKHTDQARDKINKQLRILERFQFPDIDHLKTMFDAKLSEIERVFQEYVETHDVFQTINQAFLQEDKVMKLVKDICGGGRIFKELTVDEIYSLCAEGKVRYLKEIPPGFKDAKTKDGVDKYNDFLVWKETLRFCKNEGYNLIFVTDDVKKDWWQEAAGEKIAFHEYLVNEFCEYTGHKMVGITSFDFYAVLCELFGIQIPGAVESVLKFSLQKYMKWLISSGELEEAISSELYYSGESYVDVDCLSNYDGSYFEIDSDVESIKLVDYQFEGYKDNKASYIATVNISVRGRSKEYAGRDDETNGIHLMEGCNHALEGELVIQIVRETEGYWEDVLDDFSFDEVNIISGKLQEVGVDILCSECGERVGTVIHRNGSMVCDECAVSNSEGDICPMCGEKVPHDLMNGAFCQRCSENIDF